MADTQDTQRASIGGEADLDESLIGASCGLPIRFAH